MPTPKPGTLRTGTSGLMLPGAKATFPAEYQAVPRLTYYATLFNSVEINSTFYKLPQAKTFAKWATEAGDDFRFTLKLWREITHTKPLAGDLTGIAKFMEAARQLGAKKGCLLVQFPPSITIKHIREVEAILQVLTEADSAAEWPKAVEFRHQSWYVDDAFDLIDHYRASLVLQDKGAARNAVLNEEAPFVYLRFHGPQGNYRESYDNDFLHDQAEQIHDWLTDGRDVYAYFNNTMGAAFENARTLQRLVDGLRG